MAKARSPGYPAIGLGSAIEKVSAVYNKDVQNSIPREVVARHAGYNGITGVSLSMLSSLLKYGLLTGRGDNTSVSDLALQIIAHPIGSEERRAAILEAAFNPDLFAEIRDHYKGSKVSDQALRSYLLTRKFLPSAVDGVIRAYRETMELVEEESAGYDSANVQPSREPSPMPPHAQPQQSREPLPLQRTAEDEPFQFWHAPGHLRGSFDITDLKSADEVKQAVNAWIDAWKLLQHNSHTARRPAPEETEDEL